MNVVHIPKLDSLEAKYLISGISLYVHNLNIILTYLSLMNVVFLKQDFLSVRYFTSCIFLSPMTVISMWRRVSFNQTKKKKFISTIHNLFQYITDSQIGTKFFYNLKKIIPVQMITLKSFSYKKRSKIKAYPLFPPSLITIYH